MTKVRKRPMAEEKRTLRNKRKARSRRLRGKR